MHLQRIAWIGVSTLALASWMASASTAVVRRPLEPPAPLKPSAADLSVLTLQSEVSRLHERLTPSIAPVRTRDVFRFSTRVPATRPAPRAVAPAPVADAAPQPAPVRPRPALSLIGIAEDSGADGGGITAIVSGLGDVFLVKPGDTIRAQYRVDQVSADAVLLTDIASVTTSTLALR